MNIGGLQKVSLIDYPGMICAVIFLQGCNFKCPYCHNPELVNSRLFQPCLDEDAVLNFLNTRRGKLDAVTITGGEPTIQKTLLPFIKKIRKMEFAVKLDTNGSQPQVVRALLTNKLLDFIAMDIKSPLDKYKAVAGVPIDPEKIMESISIILQTGLPCEFRTTIVKSQLTPNDILKIAALIPGAHHYVLQKFIPVKTLNKKFLQEESYSEDELEKIKKRLEKDNASVIVR
ncbi:MAG: molybdenum cofactor biosynthesis protein A [Smithella sp. PtaU1.Bin162]|nr:MAG: molybdenum cofactor biosynthesis protein A [Smithella sp. PtaU1.Bin162]